jgi:hypothetical protein
MDEINIFIGLGSVPLVTGMTEVVKRLLNLPIEWESRVIPLTAVILGIGINYLVSTQLAIPPSIPAVIVFGLISGLASSGLYSGSKSVTTGK